MLRLLSITVLCGLEDHFTAIVRLPDKLPSLDSYASNRSDPGEQSRGAIHLFPRGNSMWTATTQAYCFGQQSGRDVYWWQKYPGLPALSGRKRTSRTPRFHVQPRTLS